MIRNENIKRKVLAVTLVCFSLLGISCAGKNGTANQNSSGNANNQTAAPAGAENRNLANSNQAAEPGDASADEFEGMNSVTRAGFSMAPALLREIRTAEQNGYDRVVFEFEGGEAPNYEMAYMREPAQQCGSGDAVQVAGEGRLGVKFTPANAHTEAGRATIAARERRLNLPILKELEITCDFEAEVAVVLGVSSPNPFRVLILRDPTRVVVDIKHENK
jgi:hypothetical protein